jgi:hypothetical protein
VAVASELASVSLAFTDLEVLLPVGRFGGLIWLVAIGVLLPATRRKLPNRRGIAPAVEAG